MSFQVSVFLKLEQDPSLSVKSLYSNKIISRGRSRMDGFGKIYTWMKDVRVKGIRARRETVRMGGYECCEGEKKRVKWGMRQMFEQGNADHTE